MASPTTMDPIQMLYAILGEDTEDALAARASARDEHLSRIHALVEDGRLVLAGPMPAIDSEDPGPAGFFGSLIVAEFDSLDLARAWADADPYLAAGAWRSVDVRPFLQVLP